MASVTEGELLEALRAALESARSEGQTTEVAGALTVAELGTELGWNRQRVRDVLGMLKARGHLEVTRVLRESLDGVRRSVPAYRYVVEGGLGEAISEDTTEAAGGDGTAG